MRARARDGEEQERERSRGRESAVRPRARSSFPSEDVRVLDIRALVRERFGEREELVASSAGRQRRAEAAKTRVHEPSTTRPVAVPSAGRRPEETRDRTRDQDTTPMRARHRPADERSTQTMKVPPRMRTADREAMRQRGNAREDVLLRALSRAEQRFVLMRAKDPESARLVKTLASAFRHAPELQDRMRVLLTLKNAIEVRQKERDPMLAVEQERRVVALALVAREREDEHRERIAAAKERLVEDARRLADDEKQRVRADLLSFLRTRGSLDAQHCQRAMQGAMQSGGKGEAMVYALAMNAFPLRELQAEGGAVSGERNDERVLLGYEVARRRAAHAFEELTGDARVDAPPRRAPGQEQEQLIDADTLPERELATT